MAEYQSLFTKQAQDKLEFWGTTKTGITEPTSSYVYDSDYNLFVFKMRVPNELGLSEIISYQNAPNPNLYGIYSDLESFNFEMHFNEEKSLFASKVYLKSKGDSVKIIAKNDRLQCYYLRFKTFAISYDLKSWDIFAEAEKSNVQANIAFVKKGGVLYIIIMSDRKYAKEMQPDKLSGMLANTN